MSDAINWADYQESPPQAKGKDECKGCVFRDNIESCGKVFETAPAVFGGDCMTNNVIYIKVKELP